MQFHQAGQGPKAPAHLQAAYPAVAPAVRMNCWRMSWRQKQLLVAGVGVAGVVSRTRAAGQAPLGDEGEPQHGPRGC